MVFSQVTQPEMPIFVRFANINDIKMSCFDSYIFDKDPHPTPKSNINLCIIILGNANEYYNTR